MILLNEEYKGIKNITDGNTSQLFWVYDTDETDVKERDFYLNNVTLWQNVISDAYQLSIGDGTTWLPFNYHILIGDYDSGLDCLTPDEILGRHFQAISFSNELDESTSSLLDIKVCGYEKDKVFAVPYTKAVYPILISNDKVILVSPKDFYNKIKNTSIGSLI